MLISEDSIWNRHYRSINGTYAAAWMFDLVKTVAAANPIIQVTQFPHARFNQPSVIAKIPGKASDLSENQPRSLISGNDCSQYLQSSSAPITILQAATQPPAVQAQTTTARG
jgi:hypothetical protein